jgi:hypothetical protein
MKDIYNAQNIVHIKLYRFCLLFFITETFLSNGFTSAHAAMVQEYPHKCHNMHIPFSVPIHYRLKNSKNQQNRIFIFYSIVPSGCDYATMFGKMLRHIILYSL